MKASEQQPQAPCWQSLVILPAPRSRSELSYRPAPCKLWNAACKLDCRGFHQTARSRCYEKRRTKFHSLLSDWSPLKVTASWPSESEGHRRHQSRLPLRSHSWAPPADGFASHTASLRQWADWCIVSYLWPWVNPPSWLLTLYLFALTQVKVTENNVKVGGSSLYCPGPNHSDPGKFTTNYCNTTPDYQVSWKQVFIVILYFLKKWVNSNIFYPSASWAEAGC